jgi:hypothetical protein
MSAVPTVTTESSSLWLLARSGLPTIDPNELLSAIEDELRGDGGPLDFRTQLLIRDSIHALDAHWGQGDEARRRLSPAAQGSLDAILASDLGTPGFPSLEHRLMDNADPEVFRQFLRELGTAVTEPCRLEIGGAGALILANLLRRRTEDIDAVDEVPPALRVRHDLLDLLAKRYGLRLAHFQSQFLPSDWRQRLRSLGRFGSIDVFLMDAIDIFVRKLFSDREKDRDDLRVLARSLERDILTERLQRDAQTLLAEPRLRTNAERNWYIVFGQGLPVQ